MALWFTESTINVSEAVNRDLGRQASPAVPEEGAVDCTPARSRRCGVGPRGYLRNGCWLSQGLRSVARQHTLRRGCLRLAK